MGHSGQVLLRFQKLDAEICFFRKALFVMVRYKHAFLPNFPYPTPLTDLKRTQVGRRDGLHIRLNKLARKVI